MASIVTTKLLEALAEIGIDISKKQPSNVKTLATKNKSSATKVGLLAAERDTGGNFGTVLDIFKKEAQFIDGMNDAEQMAFLNNIMDYKEFGGSSIKNTEGIKLLDEAKNLTDEAGDLQTSISDLQSTAKTMKNDAEAGLALAEKNLDDFITTGGQPLKAKNDKYLGGSMHEEGQIRTGIRQFLQNELKNGRIKLDAMDTERVMKYFPTLEDDPILVFKKLYGDEAYNKAGSFPGAFEIGEDFNHYEKIFRENMGEDILKVKDKKYVGDGTLTLTDEVKTTTPDEDVPFATGGRASFVGGKLVDEFIAMIVKKEPIEAMKEVNKIIGKKGKYKNLTQKDIDRIVDQTNDHIFQRDPDNLFVGKRFFKDVEIKDPTFDETLPFDNDAEKLAEIKMSNEAYDMEKARGSADDKKRLLTDDEIKYYEAEIGDSETWMMDGTVEEAEKALKDHKEYIADMKREYDAASPAERAEVIGTKKVNEKFNVDNMSVEESLTTMEGLGATQTAERFRLKQKYPGITDSLLDDLINDPDPNNKAKALAVLDEAMTLQKTGKSEDQIIEILKSTPKKEMAKGGRAGYYGGGQAMVEPDLSDIGHGSDALMGRTRLTAPGSQATTSTGLNYLLGEDNDNIRVPFNEGLLVPPKKPVPPANPFNELMRIYKTYEEAMPGVSKDTQQYLQNDFKEKLQNANISINDFMTYRMQNNFADGGIAGLRQGYVGGGGVDIARRGFLKLMGATAGGVAALKMGLVKMLGKESGAVSKKVIDEVIIEGGSGAPAWLQPLVNKALREGLDKTKKSAYKDAQVVKSLDTPTGKVDVYYDVRTGEVEIDYIGGNTALGESVNMKYTPGIADEGTRTKPADEFEASEAIPEYDQSSGNFSGSHKDLGLGENTSSNVDDLYSDTSELATLGGQKPLIKDISKSIQKKKFLKKMNDDPDQFAMENAPEYYD